jgi:hypothetical protein
MVVLVVREIKNFISTPTKPIFHHSVQTYTTKNIETAVEPKSVGDPVMKVYKSFKTRVWSKTGFSTEIGIFGKTRKKSKKPVFRPGSVFGVPKRTPPELEKTRKNSISGGGPEMQFLTSGHDFLGHMPP